MDIEVYISNTTMIAQTIFFSSWSLHWPTTAQIIFLTSRSLPWLEVELILWLILMILNHNLCMYVDIWIFTWLHLILERSQKIFREPLTGTCWSYNGSPMQKTLMQKTCWSNFGIGFRRHSVEGGAPKGEIWAMKTEEECREKVFSITVFPIRSCTEFGVSTREVPP